MLVGAQTIPWGIAKTLAGLAFSLGLILVVIGGAELFTGNTLIVMAVIGRRVGAGALLRNWGVVYLGNFVGALATAVFMLLGRQYAFDGGQVGALAVRIAEHKCALDFIPAFFLGIYCNVLVCLAVWLSLGARTIPGKILAIVFPVTAFVAGGFEHCIANMYTIPLGLLIKASAPVIADPAIADPIGAALASSPHLTWGNFFANNLLPVTLGNIVGGALLVGTVYWLIYHRQAHPASVLPAAGITAARPHIEAIHAMAQGTGRG